MLALQSFSHSRNLASHGHAVLPFISLTGRRLSQTPAAGCEMPQSPRVVCSPVRLASACLVGAARRLVFSIALLAGESGTALPAEFQREEDVPTFAELQEAGALVGTIRINNQNVFDLDDPEEDNLLFRAANALHVKTRPAVIKHSLLFSTGDPVSVRLIEESERLMRCNNYLYDVRIRPTAYHDGVVDIEVTTRDTWTLDPGVAFSRAGGANSAGISLKENNLLGTGVSVGVSHLSDVDRAGTTFAVGYNHALDGRTRMDYSFSSLDDGERQAFSVVRPFYSLDARWAAGVSALTNDQVESLYDAGEVIGQYRHQQKSAEVFGGLSRGLVDGWTQRYSVGLAYLDDLYTRVPSLIAPAQLPVDQTLVSPFMRYEVIEDGFQIFTNRNQIARPEYFAMGLHAQVQVGHAFQALGSSRELWLYSASAEKGYATRAKDTLSISASLSGQYGDGHVERQMLSGGVRYYRPHKKRALFFASLSGSVVKNPEVSDLLYLGGDNGLRGYPLRYQPGEQRALLTLEERVYSDWYPFRLFRVGGAVFFDTGRAWGGSLANFANPGWLSDVGFGVRILSCRSAFGNVLHADVAFPLNSDSGIKSVQFLLKSKATF